MKHIVKQQLAVLCVIALVFGAAIPCGTDANALISQDADSLTTFRTTVSGSASSDSSATADSGSEQADYIEGEVVVSLCDDYSSKQAQTELRTAVADATVELSSTSGEETSALVTSASCDTDTLIAELNSLDSVACAEPNYRFYATSLTNDTYLNYQWYLEDGNDSGSDVSYSALTSLTPSSTPVVVVADTGIDSTQEDLKDSLYSTQMYNALTGGYETASDSDGHGTHVAGVIAAAIDNSIGIAGVSQAKLLAVKCLDADGGSLLSLINTYNYVIAQKKAGVNIRVVNMSLGGGTSNSETLNSLITQAGELGILTVCSAGNEAANIDVSKSYPASFDNDYIISVGASNASNQAASFSNYGAQNVDVYAPGTDIYSTYSGDDYNPENSHELFYEDFEDGDLDTIVNADSDSSTVSLADSVNFTASPDTTGSSSLSWTIQAQSGESYSIAIPYTIDSKQSAKAYLGMRVRVQNSPTSTDASTLAIYDTAKSLLSECTKKDITNAISGEIESMPDYWDNYSMLVANSANPKNAGTYYAIIELSAAASGQYQIYIDNVGVGNELSKYTYATGSSMSCPIVAGEVAALAGLYPNMSTSELRARVLGGVDTDSTYSGKCVSGGKVNFAKALTSPNPSINSAKIDSGTLTITGYYFGTSAGTVVLTSGGQSTTLAAQQWSDTQITLPTEGLSTGTYTVSLTRADGVSCTAPTTVSYNSPVYVSQVTLNKTAVTLAPGKSVQLYCSVFPTNASSTAILWESTNTKYATVSSTGAVTAKKAGNNHSVTITCTATDKGTVRATCRIKIRQKVKKIKLNKTKITVKAGKKVKLTAVVKPANASNSKVKWKTSNRKYATVNKKGKVTTKKAGKGHTVTITCRATDQSGKKKKCRIKII